MPKTVGVVAKTNSSPIHSKTRSRHVTMRDVAEAAGVKEACVSVVINGAKSNSHVSPVARQRILEKAQALGYKRNSSMASMAKGRFSCVALMLSTNSDLSILPSLVLEGILDELERHDIHISVFRLPDEKLTDGKNLPKNLREWMADGMLIDYTHNIPEALKSVIEENTLPGIWINSKQECDCVRPDDFAVGVNATEYLLNLGHRRIAYVDLHRVQDEVLNHYSATDRYQGYLQAMQAAGQTPQSLFGRDVPPREHAAYIQRMLQNEEHRPTALVAYGNESEAAIWAANQLGLEVPRDLSVVGLSYSGNLSAGSVWNKIPLTTFLVPEREIGQRAAVMIQQKIQDPQQKIPSQILPFIFEKGESVATPNAP